MKTETIHLGDIVYATFDGRGIFLRVGDARNEPVVYMEPAVMRALIEFWKSKTHEQDGNRSKATFDAADMLDQMLRGMADRAKEKKP